MAELNSYEILEMFKRFQKQGMSNILRFGVPIKGIEWSKKNNVGIVYD